MCYYLSVCIFKVKDVFVSLIVAGGLIVCPH